MMRRTVIVPLFGPAIQCSGVSITESNIRGGSPNYIASRQRRRELETVNWWNHSSGRSGGGSSGVSSGGSSGVSSGGSSGESTGRSSSSGGGNGWPEAWEWWSWRPWKVKDGGSGGSSSGGDDVYLYPQSDDDASLHYVDDQSIYDQTANEGSDRGSFSGLVSSFNNWVSMGTTNMFPFVAVALVSGIIGAAIMYAIMFRRKNGQGQESNPEEVLSQKRTKFISPLSKNRTGTLNSDVADGDNLPGFVELSSVQSTITAISIGRADDASDASALSKASKKSRSSHGGIYIELSNVQSTITVTSIGRADDASDASALSKASKKIRPSHDGSYKAPVEEPVLLDVDGNIVYYV